MSAESIRVGLGRSNVVLALGMLVFLGGFSLVALLTSVPDYPVGIVLGAIFGVLAVYWAIKLPLFLRPRSFEFALDGFRFWHGGENIYVPWADVLAVGIGFEAKPEEKAKLKVYASVEDAAKEKVAEILHERADEALQISGKRRLGLEIYPRSLEAFARYPRLKPYVKRLVPPEAYLPSDAWRLPLPPVMTIAQEAGRGARTFLPAGWLGWYAREWDEPAR